MKSDIIKINIEFKKEQKIKVKNQRYRNIKTKTLTENNLAFQKKQIQNADLYNIIMKL